LIPATGDGDKNANAAVAVAPVPSPPVKLTIGAEIYPVPPFVTVTPARLYPTVEDAAAPLPPPPVKLTAGAEE
jgi:hypothetical protein